jgi:calmodulin
MSNNLNRDQIEKFKNAFNLFDKEGSGTITFKEVGTVMRSLGLNPMESEIQEILRDFDTGNGTIDFPEFLTIMANKIKDIDTEEELISAFKTFDKNGKGTISMKEFRRVCTTLGEKVTDGEIDELIKVMDIDPDSDIDYYDFVKMILIK